MRHLIHGRCFRHNQCLSSRSHSRYCCNFTSIPFSSCWTTLRAPRPHMQQNLPIQSAASPHSTTLHHHHHQRQHQQQPQHQHYNQQDKKLYQAQQHPAIGASPPITPGTSTADVTFRTTPYQHPHSPQLSCQHRVLGVLSASDTPQSTSGCLSGPVAMALEVSRFTASCRIHSPGNSQQGLPQLATPPALGVGLNVSGNISGGVRGFSSEKMSAGSECLSAGSEQQRSRQWQRQRSPYGANVPGWGVPRDLEEHLEMSLPRPTQELQRQLSFHNQPPQAQQVAVERPPTQMAFQQPPQESSWMQQPGVSTPGDGVAVSIGHPCWEEILVERLQVA